MASSSRLASRRWRFLIWEIAMAATEPSDSTHELTPQNGNFFLASLSRSDSISRRRRRIVS